MSRGIVNKACHCLPWLKHFVTRTRSFFPARLGEERPRRSSPKEEGAAVLSESCNSIATSFRVMVRVNVFGVSSKPVYSAANTRSTLGPSRRIWRASRTVVFLTSEAAVVLLPGVVALEVEEALWSAMMQF